VIEVINRQRRIPLDCERWQKFARRALKVVPAKGAGVTIVFVSDAAMRTLNHRWRDRRSTTDVLSFSAAQSSFERSADPRLGDVVISLARAAAQAREHGLTIDDEIAQLILHGLLHLCGYDHETDDGEMNRLELRLRRRLKI